METFLERLALGLRERGNSISFAFNQTPDRGWVRRHGISYVRLYNSGGKVWEKIFWIVFYYRPLFLTKFFGDSTHKKLTSSLIKSDWKTVVRYLPFFKIPFDSVYFPWNSAAVKYEKLMEINLSTTISCRGAQILIAPHNPLRNSQTAGIKATLNKAHWVHCVSRNIEKQVEIYCGTKNKIRVISPAVDPDFFTPSTSQPKGDLLRILSVGSLIWRKGYEFALQAMAELKKREIVFQFTIVGDGEDYQRILFAIEDLNLKNNVLLTGHLDSNDILKQIKNSHIFLLSSLSEGIANSVLEAMSCSLSVISTRCGGMEEVISDGENGFLTPLRDVQRTLDCLLRLWNEKDLRKRLGENARQTILQNHSLRSQLEAFEFLLA